MMDLMAFCHFPELRPGIVIDFIDKSGKMRTQAISDRKGEYITVKNALEKKTVIHTRNVIGYWEKNVKLIRINRISLKK